MTFDSDMNVYWQEEKEKEIYPILKNICKKKIWLSFTIDIIFLFRKLR
jgi:hypothetical protein